MDAQQLVKDCACNIIERYYNFIANNIINGISFEEFTSKIFNKSATTSPFNISYWDDLLQYSIDIALTSEAKSNAQDPDPTYGKSRALLTILLHGLSYAAEAYREAENGSKPGWPHLLRALETIVQAEAIVKLKENPSLVSETERKIFSRKGVIKRQDLTLEKELVKKMLIDYCKDGGKWKSRRYAALYIAPHLKKYNEENQSKLPEDERVYLSDEKMEFTIKKWFNEIPESDQYFHTLPSKIKRKAS